MAGLLLTAALTAGSLLWGRVCHHVEREASAGWQHKHVRHLIDLVYAGLDQR
jgi:hypothetical protein